MDFYFPDSQDQVDPRFDFESEQRSPFHVRQRDDLYAHEVHDEPPYTGMLVSKTMVDGCGSSGRYTSAQRHRLYRLGVRDFFRLPEGMKTLGDCGAFSYAAEPEPPVSVAEVVAFYDGCGFDAGISVDHVILGYSRELDDSGDVPPADWVERQELTLRLAEDFLAEHTCRGCDFEPVGVAQGWSPSSYAHSVERLQDLGYRRIALGGMVPLKTDQILDCLGPVDDVRLPDTVLHLLGVTRIEHVDAFATRGVTSFDSTAPFRQAFKDSKDNFWTAKQNFVALRIPPSDGNARVQRRVRAGQLDQRQVREREREALRAVRAWDEGSGTRNAAVDALLAYEELHDEKKAGTRTERYRETLQARPWRDCPCQVCRRWGVEVAIFRGTERNKRRGFHNLWVFNQTFQGHLAGAATAAADKEVSSP